MSPHAFRKFCGQSALQSFAVLACAVAALAQDAAPAAPPRGTGQTPFEFILGTVNFFLVAFFVYYWLVLRPNQQKQEEQVRFLKDLKKDDEVVTSGGILGRVASVQKDQISIEVAPGMRLRVQPDHVFSANPKETPPPAVEVIDKKKPAKGDNRKAK